MAKSRVLRFLLYFIFSNQSVPESLFKILFLKDGLLASATPRWPSAEARASKILHGEYHLGNENLSADILQKKRKTVQSGLASRPWDFLSYQKAKKLAGSPLRLQGTAVY